MAHDRRVEGLFAVELGVNVVADGVHIANEVAHVAALAGAAETLTGGTLQAAGEQLTGLHEGAFPVVQAVRLDVAAALELGEALLNLFEGAINHVELIAAGLLAEDDLTNPSGGVEIFGELGCSAELFVVLGEAGEEAVYFAALVAGFGFSGAGKSASAGGAGQGDSSQRLSFKNTNVEAASCKNLRAMSQMHTVHPPPRAPTLPQTARTRRARYEPPARRSEVPLPRCGRETPR